MTSTLIIGCGYLGTRVANLWLAQSRKVLATTRKPVAPVPGVEPIVCDILDPARLPRLPDVDTLLYAIGFDRSSGATMRTTYVDGLANVLDRLPNPRRFIYISSSSVYG